MDNIGRIWSLTASFLEERGEADFHSVGRTRQECLDEFLVLWDKQVIADYGQPETWEGEDGEMAEDQRMQGNEIHTFFMANPDADEYWDEMQYRWHLNWSEAPGWLQSLCTEPMPEPKGD